MYQVKWYIFIIKYIEPTIPNIVSNSLKFCLFELAFLPNNFSELVFFIAVIERTDSKTLFIAPITHPYLHSCVQNLSIHLYSYISLILYWHIKNLFKMITITRINE